MTPSRPATAEAALVEQAVRRAGAALALVLDLHPGDLRADSPLADLGADSIALVQWADVAEEAVAREDGRSIAVDDDVLAAARTLGDLAEHLAAVTR
jgi:acyl carrier protein